jgi:hypothetical protein
MATFYTFGMTNARQPVSVTSYTATCALALNAHGATFLHAVPDRRPSYTSSMPFAGLKLDRGIPRAYGLES